MTGELKPCPFCGGEARPMVINNYKNQWVQCPKCFEGLSAMTGKTWNTRTPTPAEPQGAPETRTADEILRDPETYEMVETLLYLADDGHLTETPTETVAGVYTLKATPAAPQGVTDVQILTMKLSGGREEHWTRVSCDGRTFDVRVYGGDYRNRAEYEKAELRHVLLGEPKPDLMAAEYMDKEVAPSEPEGAPETRIAELEAVLEDAQDLNDIRWAKIEVLEEQLATARNEALESVVSHFKLFETLESEGIVMAIQQYISDLGKDA